MTTSCVQQIHKACLFSHGNHTPDAHLHFIPTQSEWTCQPLLLQPSYSSQRHKQHLSAHTCLASLWFRSLLIDTRVSSPSTPVSNQPGPSWAGMSRWQIVDQRHLTSSSSAPYVQQGLILRPANHVLRQVRGGTRNHKSIDGGQEWGENS